MAAKPLTKCPNCSSKITNRFECRNCGLLFDRYFKAEARRKKEEKARAAKKVRTNQILGTIATLAAIVIIGGGSYYFFNQQSEEGSAPRATPSPQAQTTTAQNPKQASVSPLPEGQPNQPGNTRTRAINATVAIHAPWGEGTGFFIRQDKLVTNRHIAEYGEDRLQGEIEQYEELQKTLEEEKDNIQTMKNQVSFITDSQEKTEYEASITQREQRLEEWVEKLAKDEEHITTIQEQIKAPDIYIILADGRKVYMAYMETSSNHDLALLTVFETGVSPILTAETTLQEKDPTYSPWEKQKINERYIYRIQPRGLSNNRHTGSAPIQRRPACR